MTIARRLGIALMLSLTIIAFGAGRLTAGDDRPIKLFLDEKELKPDVPPAMINDRVLVPVRIVSESLGCEVKWDEENWAVKIYTKDYQPPQQPGRKSGILTNLTQAQIDEAVDIGVTKKASFSWGPYVRSGGQSPYNISVTLYTEYASLIQLGEDLKTSREDIDANRNLMKGNILIVASVNGDSVDFPKGCNGVLMQGWTVVQPISEDKPTLAKTSPYWPSRPAYRATMSFLFRLSDLDLEANSQFDFVLVLPSGARPAVIFDAVYLK